MAKRGRPPKNPTPEPTGAIETMPKDQTVIGEMVEAPVGGPVVEPKRGQGRPTKWKPEYNKMIVDYFSIEPSYIKEIITEGQGKSGAGWKKVEYKFFPNKLPTLLQFAMKIGVEDDTLVEWAKEENKQKYPGFSASYYRAKELFKEFICHNALTGVHNPIFAKFLLINTSGMHDTPTLPGGSVTTNILVLKQEVAKMSDDEVDDMMTKFLNKRLAAKSTKKK